MKKNIIIAAVAAASALLLCASCQKQEIIEQNEINAESKVFTASIEQGLTKTTITGDYKVNWVTGDEVSINGKEYVATADAANPTKATLAPAEDQPVGKEGGYYYALYPASLCDEDEQGELYFELPATQTYSAGEFNAPMYAVSETEDFKFNNICGVICLSLKGTDKVKSISVTANEAISGVFEMTDATTVNLTGDGRTVTLNCGEGVQLSSTDSTNFYIYLPPKDSYSAGMKIVVTSTDDKTFEKTTTKAVKIERNNLYTFDLTATFSAPGPAYTGELVIGDYTITDEVSLDGGTSVQTFTVISKDGTDSNISIKNLANDDNFEWYATYNKDAHTLTLDGSAYGYEQYVSIFLYTHYSIGSYSAGYFAGNSLEGPIVFSVDPATHQISGLQTDYGIFASDGSSIIGYFKYFAAGVATIVKKEQ